MDENKELTPRPQEEDLPLSQVPEEESTTLPELADPAPEDEELLPAWLTERIAGPTFEEGVQSEEGLFTTPYTEETIAADEGSIAYHGMAHPNDPEPDYQAYLYDEPAPQEADPAGEFRDPMADEEFNALFSREEKEEEPAVPTKKAHPVRKGRPKRKKGDGLLGIPHILATAVWLALIVLIGVTLGRMAWVCAADVLAFGRQDRTVAITIDSDDTIDTISEKLHQAGLIRYPGLFRLYAGLTVDEGEISTGTFTLNTLYDYHALVGGMSSSSSTRAVIEDVLIPEGYSCRQIFALLEEKGICTVSELEDYAADGEFADFWFLEGVERGHKYCLEGFLFPDTYDFYEKSTPREALGKMLLGFKARFTDDLYEQLPTLNQRLSKMMRANGCSEDFIAKNQLDLLDLITVASLIEEETSSAKESPTIASVIYNRLTQDQAYERYLGIDAAIIYATGDSNRIDTSIDSPYNTYKNPGLTPGPISNPGLDSINAALNFADTAYYYYVLNPQTGVHTFSRTLQEHEALIEKYRQG